MKVNIADVKQKYLKMSLTHKEFQHKSLFCLFVFLDVFWVFIHLALHKK